MAITNRWNDVSLERMADLPKLPSIPDVAVKVARSMPRQSTSPLFLRLYGQPNGLAGMSVTPDVDVPRGLAGQDIGQQQKQSWLINQMSFNKNETLDRIWDFIKEHEGVYSNDKDDRGGETKFGIASRFHPGVDVKNITEQDARNIWENEYYKPSGADRMNPGIGLYLADAAFNQGLGGMRSIMQNAIHTTNIDRMNTMNQRDVLEKIHNARMERYRGTPGWNKFARGWTRRADEAYNAALALLGG